MSPKEFPDVDAGADPDPDSVSVVLALLSVAPKSIWPSHVPAKPPAIPASKGLRWNQEGDVAGVGWAVGLFVV
jgi:apolipoprotein N-acyltransferase